MRVRVLELGLSAAIWAVAGCGPATPRPTGGTDVTPGPFGRGLVVVDTDFQSTNVSLVGLDGAVLSLSFISTASSKMSWDVQAPTSPSVGDDVVLLDRTFGLVSWVDARTAKIRAQLHVDGDQLGKNPWDYLPVSREKAYVTRYDRWPGNSANGDLVVVNPTTSTVTTVVDRRIDVAAKVVLPKGHVVHPARGVVLGGRAFFTTVNATVDYAYDDSAIVTIDTSTDAIVAVQKLDGLHDCTGITASPSGGELAVSCAGDLQANGDPSLATAGVVVLDAADLSEKKRFPAAGIGSGVPGFSLSYAGDHALVVILLGNVKDAIDDAAIVIDTSTGATRELHRAGPVQLGAVLCPARVDGASGGRDPEACFLTDADTFSLVRFPVASGTLGDPLTIDVDEGRGRPPRYVGQF